MIMADPYLLRQEAKVHEKGIRSLCVLQRDQKIVTAGYDGLVIVWTNNRSVEVPNTASVDQSTPDSEILPVPTPTPTSVPNAYEPELVFTEHTGVVYSVCDGGKTDGSGSTFFSGGQDKKIFWVTSEGKILKTFNGHTGVVCSLCRCKVNNREVLLSGSWDTTAKIWDLDTGACLYTLSGHTYAVSVFSWSRLGSPSDSLITGSQNGYLHIWDFELNGLTAPVKTFPSYHNDIIRGFALANDSTLLSCSNDGTFKALDLKNDQFLKTKHASDTFIFDIATYRNGDLSLVLTGSEDGSLGVWDFPSANGVQVILHSSTVWKVGVLANGDLLSGCEDGTLRIWTTDEMNAAPVEQRDRQKDAALQAHKAVDQHSSVDVNKLPDISQLPSLRGTKAGQHKMFKDGSRAVLYIWNGHVWEFVDEVVQSGSIMGRYFNGDDYFTAGEYDYIFDAEVADDGRKRPIPYRVGENTLVVAEKFCAREGISKSHVPQIEEFIKQNTTRSVPHAQQIPPSSLSSSLSVPSKTSPTRSNHFPPLDFIIFRTYHADKLKQKLLEFNDQLPADLRMTELEKSYLDCLITKLNQPRLANEDLRVCEIDLAFQSHLIEWPISSLFPVIDLWRILALHPQSTDLHKKSDGGWHYIATALRLAKSVQPGLALCCMRYLANLFDHPTNRSTILKYEPQILEALPEFPVHSATRHVRSAEASIFVNLCLALGQTGHPIPLATAENVMRTLSHRLQQETDEGVRYHLLVAIGTLLSHLTSDIRQTVSQSLQLPSINGGTAKELKACQLDVEALL